MTFKTFYLVLITFKLLNFCFHFYKLGNLQITLFQDSDYTIPSSLFSLFREDDNFCKNRETINEYLFANASKMFFFFLTEIRQILYTAVS